MTLHITVEQALRIAEIAIGSRPEVRDMGLLKAAVLRPRATAFGEEAYPDTFAKAAALLHSLARNHALVDGNKRLTWLATYVFCAKNEVELDPADDSAYDLVVAVAAGQIDEVEQIAVILRSFVR